MSRWLSFALALAVFCAAPAVAAAQEKPARPAAEKVKGKKKQQDKGMRARAKKGHARPAEERRRDRDDDVVVVPGARRGATIVRVPSEGKRGPGPRFCRSGAGHPVFGRQWCLAKGFGLGDRHGAWGRATWDDVIFRAPRREAAVSIGRSILIDVLGDVVFGRIDARRRVLGLDEPLAGRWLATDGDWVLLLGSGGVAVAELVDFDRDRRVDLVLLNLPD